MVAKRFISAGILCLAAAVLATPPARGEGGYVYVTEWPVPDPLGIAVDGTGNVYVASGGDGKVEKFTNTGTLLTGWTPIPTGDPHISTVPNDVAVDAAGNVYIVLQGQHGFITPSYSGRVQKFTSDGTFITQWGGAPGDGIFPRFVTADVAGNIIIDSFSPGGTTLRRYSTEGTYITAWSVPDPHNNEVCYIAADAFNHVYVTAGAQVHKFTNTGTELTAWGSQGAGDGQFEFNTIGGLSTDISGNVYVADRGNRRIQVFTSEGVFLTKWGSYGAGQGQFLDPNDVAVDGGGNVYVACDGRRIQKFAPALTAAKRETFGSVKAKYRPSAAAQDRR